MAWQQSDLDAIDLALKSNLRTVIFADGRRVDYHSPAEMLQVRNAIKRELAGASLTSAPRTRTVVGRVRRRRC